MVKPSFRYVAYGVCPKCGQPLVRNLECTIGVCTCESAIKVALKPCLLFRINSRLYKKIEKTSKMLHVEVEEFVNRVYETALNDKAFMVEAVKELRGCKQ